MLSYFINDLLLYRHTTYFTPSIFSSIDSIHCSFNCDYVEDDLLKTCGIFKGFPPPSTIISTFVYRYKNVILKHRKALPISSLRFIAKESISLKMILLRTKPRTILCRHILHLTAAHSDWLINRIYL
jgi:hypothetical protein